MSIISRTLPSAEQTLPGTSASRQAVKDLAVSLRTGDLDAAKSAYAEVVRNAPEGASWNPEGAFAELGRALKAGDLDAARAAAREAVRNALPTRNPEPRPVGPGLPEPAPVPSSTGGASGTLLNVVV